MSCPYSEWELQEWDSVCNPMGDACYDCHNCYCEHWAGDHSEYCPQGNSDCIDSYINYDMEE